VILKLFVPVKLQFGRHFSCSALSKKYKWQMFQPKFRMLQLHILNQLAFNSVFLQMFQPKFRMLQLHILNQLAFNSVFLQEVD